jgi:hypothetical protein
MIEISDKINDDWKDDIKLLLDRKRPGVKKRVGLRIEIEISTLIVK